MKRVLLCPNLSRDKDLSLTLSVRELLRPCGADIVICPLFEELNHDALPEGIEAVCLEDELGCADMLIAFGGDGTILRAARAAAPYSLPILGVNMGTMGFMAELEKEDVGRILPAVSGAYVIERRMMLDVDLVRDGTVIFSDFALNDVVIAGMTKIVDLRLFGDGQKISHFSGDGAIISTPTGSTAYSMAAGGPIVEPNAENIIVTPICAHVLAAKAFVLAPERHVTVELGHIKANPAYLSVDGGPSLGLVSGDIINVRKSAKVTLFVHLSDKSFYKKVSEKLGEQF